MPQRAILVKHNRSKYKRSITNCICVPLHCFRRMQYNQRVSLCVVALVLAQTAALPQHPQQYNAQQYPQQYQQQQVREERKFAEKPNAMKKVAIDDLEDISTNQIQVMDQIKEAERVPSFKRLFTDEYFQYILHLFSYNIYNKNK